MPGTNRSRTTSIITFAVLVGSLSVQAVAQVRFEIPAESLAQALRTLGGQANLNVYFDPPTVRGLQAPELRAAMTADDALAKLLAGTRLKAVRVDQNTIRVIDDSAKEVSGPRQTTGANFEPNGLAYPTSMHLASVGDAALTLGGSDEGARTDERTSGNAGNGREGVGLQEVIVSAQKRDERIQDVPVPLSVLDSQELIEQNQVRLQDYYSSVPGLVLRTDGHGYGNISIRGLTTGAYTNPTVGIVIDDVPFGATNTLGSRTSAPDLDPSDIARIEVLRGPQGTLYGASSLGGLLKFVTVDPSTERVSGRLQADISTVQNGSSLGYGFRGAINLPLTDTLAMRLSAFSRQDAGYIDNPTLHLDGVNQVEVYGGRYSVLWHPTDSFSWKLSALLQNTKANGPADVTLEPGLRDLQQDQLLPGGYHHEIRAFTSTLKADVGLGINVAAITGYSIDKYDSPIDISFYYGPFAQSVFDTPLAQQIGQNRTAKVTQEVRLSGSNSHLDWIIGGYYDHDDNNSHDVYNAVDPVSRAVLGLLLDDPYPMAYQEFAGFGDLTVHLTGKFDVQVGAREGYSSQSYREPMTGPVVGGFFDNPLVHTKDHAFTYLFTPQYKFSSDFMVYARLASGFRPGGPNPTCTVYSVPCAYGHDETRNYELGTKGDLLSGRVTFDASIYYIDWRHIQVQISDPVSGSTFYTNASSAKSKGVELSSQMRPVDGLTVAFGIALNDAKLNSDLPPNNSAVGLSGDRLPYSAKFSGNLSVQQEFPLSQDLTGFVGGTLSYLGNRRDNFPAPETVRREVPGYTDLNLRAGVHDEAWSANVFVNNVTDRRGILAYPPSFANSNPIVNYIQPRTVGLSVSRTF